MEPEGRQAGDQRSQRRAEAGRRLLEAGLSIMSRQGIHQTKVEQITRAAGVGKGSFFSHFTSKDYFVAALVEHLLDDLAARVGPLGLTPHDAEDLLASLNLAHLRYFQMRPEAASLLGQACCLEGEAGRKISLRLNQYVDLVAQMIGPACAHLGWPAARSPELALFILAGSCGLTHLARSGDLTGELDLPLLERLARCLSLGLAVQASKAP